MTCRELGEQACGTARCVCTFDKEEDLHYECKRCCTTVRHDKATHTDRVRFYRRMGYSLDESHRLSR